MACTAAMIFVASAPGGAQRPRCASAAVPPPRVVYASFGSATGAHRRLNDALTSNGVAPLADNATVAGFGFWIAPWHGCSLLQGELNIVSWEARRAADGRQAEFWAGDFMVYGGAPVITSGRTSVYPLLGVGVRMHFLDVSGAGGSSDTGRTTFATALHRDGEWDGPGQVVGDLAVGAHYLAGSPASRHSLVIGARMGYVVGPGSGKWIIGADTIRGPKVNTSGPYGRLLVGMSFGRREGVPARRPPRRPEDVERVRTGRPTRRIG